jgi:hypothetical protein
MCAYRLQFEEASRILTKKLAVTTDTSRSGRTGWSLIHFQDMLLGHGIFTLSGRCGV